MVSRSDLSKESMTATRDPRAAGGAGRQEDERRCPMAKGRASERSDPLRLRVQDTAIQSAKSAKSMAVRVRFNGRSRPTFAQAGDCRWSRARERQNLSDPCPARVTSATARHPRPRDDCGCGALSSLADRCGRGSGSWVSRTIPNMTAWAGGPGPQGRCEPSDLVEAAIERIERHDPILNAVVYKGYDEARAAAKGRCRTGRFAACPSWSRTCC